MGSRKEYIAGEHGMQLFVQSERIPLTDDDVRAVRRGDFTRAWEYFAHHIRNRVCKVVESYYSGKRNGPGLERKDEIWCEMIGKIGEYLERYPELIPEDRDSVTMLAQFVYAGIRRDTRRSCERVLSNKVIDTENDNETVIEIVTENDPQSPNLRDMEFGGDDIVSHEHRVALDKLQSELVELGELVTYRYLYLQQTQNQIARDYGISTRTVRRHVERCTSDNTLLDKVNQTLCLSYREYPQRRRSS